MSTKFNYSTQHYFPNHVKLIGIGLFIGGLIAFTSGNQLISLALIFIGAFIFMTMHGIEIDLNKKTYVDYLSLFGFKKGKAKKFRNIESVYITGGTKTTKMQLRGHATTISEQEYNGYVKFSKEEKVHLLSSTKKEHVEKLLKQMSADLNVTFVDYSEPN